MKYFILKTDYENNSLPVILDWYDMVKKEHIQIGKAHLLPKWILLRIKNSDNLFFPDILTYPFFLVSENMKGIIELYIPKLEWKRVILYVKDSGLEKLYYLPILEGVLCLGEGSRCTPDKSKMEHVVLDKDKIEDKILFRIADVRDSYIIIRMDLIESMIRRGACCLSLEEVSVIEN